MDAVAEKDERGRPLGFAEEDRPYAYLDPAGAKEASRRKGLRVIAARDLDRSAPAIDPAAETLALAASVPRGRIAPVGARLTASDEQKRLSSGIKESARERRDREAAAREREHEQRMAIGQELLANMQKRPA